MREHLSSLHGSMVLALLANAKTATRRLVKPSNSLVNGERWTKAQWATLAWSWACTVTNQMCDPLWMVPDVRGFWHEVTPRIQPGDVMAFREALACYGMRARYAADLTDPPHPTLPDEPYPWRWKANRIPPMYCPRDAIRLRREVVSVLPSTPADVTTPEEALAEGLVDCGDMGQGWNRWGWRGHPVYYATPREAFAALLAHVHGRPVPETAPCWRYGLAEA